MFIVHKAYRNLIHNAEHKFLSLTLACCLRSCYLVVGNIKGLYVIQLRLYQSLVKMLLRLPATAQSGQVPEMTWFEFQIHNENWPLPSFASIVNTMVSRSLPITTRLRMCPYIVSSNLYRWCIKCLSSWSYTCSFGRPIGLQGCFVE